MYTITHAHTHSHGAAVTLRMTAVDAWHGQVILGLLKYWPIGSSTKQTCFLNELEDLFAYVQVRLVCSSVSWGGGRGDIVPGWASLTTTVHVVRLCGGAPLGRSGTHTYKQTRTLPPSTCNSCVCPVHWFWCSWRTWRRSVTS